MLEGPSLQQLSGRIRTGGGFGSWLRLMAQFSLLGVVLHVSTGTLRSFAPFPCLIPTGGGREPGLHIAPIKVTPSLCGDGMPA